MSPALGVLNEVIDGNRLPRKALADDIGKTEQAFSKMTAGVQSFGLDDFGKLPRDLQIAFWKRYGREVLGLEVREIDHGQLVEEFYELVERMGRLAQLSRVVTGKAPMAKVEMPVEQQKKRSA